MKELQVHKYDILSLASFLLALTYSAFTFLFLGVYSSIKCLVTLYAFIYLPVLFTYPYFMG